MAENWGLLLRTMWVNHLESGSFPSQALRWQQTWPTWWLQPCERPWARITQLSHSRFLDCQELCAYCICTVFGVIIIQLYITNTLSLPETIYQPPDFCNPSTIALAIFWLSCFHLSEISSFLGNELKNKHWYFPWLLDSQGLTNTVTGKNFNKYMQLDYTVST